MIGLLITLFVLIIVLGGATAYIFYLRNQIDNKLKVVQEESTTKQESSTKTTSQPTKVMSSGLINYY
jgi:Tfp pilus assembly protein PilO